MTFLPDFIDVGQPRLVRIWQNIRGDVRRIGLLLLVGALALAAMRLVPWQGTPGDLLSMLVFVLVAMFACAHLLRRIMLPTVQLGALADCAAAEPLAAAIVFLAIAVLQTGMLLALVMLFATPGHAAGLPPGLPEKAYRNLPIVLAEQQRYWPDHPARSLLAAQIEQETCPTLQSRQCWSERAELRTPREQGIGLGQITRTARFDAMAAIQQQYAGQFAGWSWDQPYDARFQARALVLQGKRCYLPITGSANVTERLAMSLNCYNAGPGMLAISRTRCAVRAGCDPARWFGHVELAEGPSRHAGYGQRSFHAISREYVRRIMQERRPRYRFLDV